MAQQTLRFPLASSASRDDVTHQRPIPASVGRPAPQPNSHIRGREEPRTSWACALASCPQPAWRSRGRAAGRPCESGGSGARAEPRGRGGGRPCGPGVCPHCPSCGAAPWCASTGTAACTAMRTARCGGACAPAAWQKRLCARTSSATCPATRPRYVLSNMPSALMTAPGMSTLRRMVLLYIETPLLRALMVQGPRLVSVRAAMRGRCGGRALWALWQ